MDWDLSSLFPAFGDSEYREFVASLTNDFKAMTARLDGLAALDANSLPGWTELLVDYEQLTARFSHLASYLNCLSAADASNDEVERERGLLAEFGAEKEKLDAHINSALGKADEAVFDQLLAQDALNGLTYPLERRRIDAQHLMDQAQEALAAELSIHGIKAWSQWYDTISGQLRFTYNDGNGHQKEVPMAQRVSLITSPEREVRRSAFEGANEAWAKHAAGCNSALNAIAGTRLTLDKRRGVDHFLDNACFQSALKRETLDALFQAIDDNIDVPRDILAFRAQKQGLDKVAMYDIGAPLPIPDAEAVNWKQGCQLIQNAFDRAYPALGSFFTEVLQKRWVDYQTRDNKRPGGFCSSSRLNNESRIFMTFKDTMSAVMTLAHEVGHAWHTRVMAKQRPFASFYPMTLAESASTFAELLLADGIVESDETSQTQKAVLLDSETGHALAFLLDIPVRFRWEKRFYEERRKGTISVNQMKSMMEEEQRRSFGDRLAPDGKDPYFWASKLHFYIDNTMFYNYPYSFGYLLSLSLFARFQAEGAAFLPAYEAFLGDTGQMDCAEVVRKNLGEDIRDPAFWQRAIRSLEPNLAALRGM